MTTRYTLPAVLREENLDLAVELVRRYTNHFDGAHFESYGVNDPDRITSDDLVAVSMLSVFVPARAALQIRHDAEKITELLKEIRPDVNFFAAEADALLLREREAWKLWDLLLGYSGMGPTMVSKVMARKRPRLIPVQDSVVRAAVGWTPRSNFWAGMRALLIADDGALVERLRRIRDKAGVGERYSEIRIFDIAVWTAAKVGEEPST